MKEMRPDSTVLHFHTLEKYLRDALGIEKLTEEGLKCLGLMDRGGYNSAAELLSDENLVPGSYILITYDEAFGIADEKIEHVSVLKMAELALEAFDKLYKDKGSYALVPREAFAVALLDSILYRDYTYEEPIRILFAEFGASLICPGGLMGGVGEEGFSSGSVSILRNMTLATIFLKLGLVTKLGTSVRKIIEAYKGMNASPSIFISEGETYFCLPADKNAASMAAKVYLDILISGKSFTMKDLANVAYGFQSTAGIDSFRKRLIEERAIN